MRRNRTVICPSCHARWEADRARFCGWCGVALRPTELSTESSPSRGPWPGRLVRVGGVVVAVAMVAVLGTLVDDLQLPRSRPDPAVELADEGEDAVVPQGEALSDAERAALLAPFDPDRLRCEPAGCEVWRLDLVDDAGDGDGLEVAVLGDLVVVSAGDEITGHDLTTGDRRWQRTWPRIDDRSATGWTIMMAGAPTGPLVLARPQSGHLLALTPDGEEVWLDHEPRPLQNFQVVGDALVTSHLERPGRRGDQDEAITFPSEQIVVRDLVSGDHRWERSNVSLMGAGKTVVLAREGEDTVLLDATTGAELGRRTLPDDAWLYPIGTVLLQFGSEGTQVVDHDFSPIAGLDDLAEVQPLYTGAIGGVGSGPSDAGLLLGRRRSDDGGAGELVLADDHGRVLWEVAVPPADGALASCCPQPHLVGDVLVVPVEREDGPGQLRFALADGARVTGDGEPVPDAWTPTTWWLAPGTAVDQEGDAVRLHVDDGVVEVRGGGWPRNAEEPFVFNNGRSVVVVRPVDAG